MTDSRDFGNLSNKTICGISSFIWTVPLRRTVKPIPRLGIGQIFATVLKGPTTIDNVVMTEVHIYIGLGHTRRTGVSNSPPGFNTHTAYPHSTDFSTAHLRDLRKKVILCTVISLFKVSNT
jgi:hypothetical protein